jgi:hypothetical protein
VAAAVVGPQGSLCILAGIQPSKDGELL